MSLQRVEKPTAAKYMVLNNRCAWFPVYQNVASMALDKEYFIGLYWGSRKEDIDPCANKVKATVALLSNIDNSFHFWYETSRPRKGKILQPLDISIEGIRALLLKGRNYNDIGKLLEDLGYLIYLKSEKDYSKAHLLSISCGCYCELISNCVALTIGRHETNKHLVTKANLESIYTSLVEIWHPDKGIIQCNDEELVANIFR